MRIAIVTTSFLPQIGGAEFVIHHLAQQWCRQGHEVRVINAITDQVTQSDALYSVRQYHIPRGASRFGYHRWVFSRLATRALSRRILEFAPNTISAHFGWPTAIWLSRMHPVPRFIITCHGPALNETPSGPRQRYGVGDLLASAMNAAKASIAISSHAREVMERIGVDPARIVDIPNGVDLEKFRARVDDFDLRAYFKIPPEAKVVLSVGRELWAKAYDKGLAAFAKAAARVSDVYYVILGKGTSTWRPLTRQLGIADRVVFCEGLYGRELVGAYQQADVFFLPSIKELCPVVVPEAMGAGLPAIVTNVSGSQDMIRTGHNGFVTEPGNADDMANALLRLLQDEDLRRRMGAANLAESNRYDWDRISRAYLEQM